MTNKETRKWAFEQATRFFRNGEVKATLEFAEKIYEFMSKEDCCAKTPTKENCPETINNVCSESSLRPKPKSQNEVHQTGILRNMQYPLDLSEVVKATPKEQSETMSFDTLEDLMNFIIKSEEK